MLTKPLVWSEPRPPTREYPASYYDNVHASTPFGWIMIEWKSWKENDSYLVTFPWEEILGNIEVWCQASEMTLEEAKRKAQEELEKRVRDCVKIAECS